MPKYTVDSAEQLGLSGPGSKANPAKAAEMEKKQAQSEAKQQAAAAKVSSQVVTRNCPAAIYWKQYCCVLRLQFCINTIVSFIGM